MNKVTIIKSPNGDTRTAKGDVSFEEFQKANDKKFTEMDWYKNHIKDERHHIKDHCPDDVDLIDVLEMIADSTTAALARSGGLKYPLEIDKDILYKAFENTCKMVLDACELKDK